MSGSFSFVILSPRLLQFAFKLAIGKLIIPYNEFGKRSASTRMVARDHDWIRLLDPAARFARVFEGGSPLKERAQGDLQEKAQGMPDAQCTRSRACVVVGSTRVSHHRFTGRFRHSLRGGVTAYSELSLVTGLVCHHHRCDAKHHHQLDASVGASGPHGFTVRNQRFVQRADAHLTPLASTASHPNDRDDHDAPLSRGGTPARSADLPWMNSELFCGGILDRANHAEFSQKSRVLARRLALPVALNSLRQNHSLVVIYVNC
jgi:hypothetical protein